MRLHLAFALLLGGLLGIGDEEDPGWLAEALASTDPDVDAAIVAYDAGEQTARGTQSVMILDSVDLADPVLHDVAAGEQAPVAGYQKDPAAGLTRLALPLADYPLILEYKRFSSPLYGEEERLLITGKRQTSVEEILAAHQAFQSAQNALLANARADALRQTSIALRDEEADYMKACVARPYLLEDRDAVLKELGRNRRREQPPEPARPPGTGDTVGV